MIFHSLPSCERFCASRLGAAAICLGLALVLVGCSISMPLPGFIDYGETGSIKPKTATADGFDVDDWKIAEPALRKAIHAGAEAESARWDNPGANHRGEFRAVAGSFKRDGASCRAFLAKVESDEGARELQGVGCERDGALALEDVAPWKGI